MSIWLIIILIFFAILLIVMGSLGVNIFNKCEDINKDSVAKGEKGFEIALIVAGILLLLYTVYEVVFGSSQTS